MSTISTTPTGNRSGRIYVGGTVPVYDTQPLSTHSIGQSSVSPRRGSPGRRSSRIGQGARRVANYSSSTGRSSNSGVRIGSYGSSPSISVRPTVVVPIGTRRFEHHYQRPEYYTGCFSALSGRSSGIGFSTWACRDNHDRCGWGLRNTLNCYGTGRYAHSRGLTRYYNRRWHGRVCFGDSYFYPSYYPTFFPCYGSSSRTYIYNDYSDDASQYKEVDSGGWQGDLPSPAYQNQSDVATADGYSHTQLGLAAFVDGEFDVARREFVRAIIAAPEDAELLMLYGYAHFATGDYLVSSLAIKRALSLDATLIESPIDLLSLYSDEPTFERHVVLLDKYTGNNSDDSDAAFLAGFVRYASGRAQEAAAMFGKQVDTEQSDAVVWLLRDAALRVSQAQQLMRAAERSGSASPAPLELQGGDVPSMFDEVPAVPIPFTDTADELPTEVL